MFLFLFFFYIYAYQPHCTILIFFSFNLAYYVHSYFRYHHTLFPFSSLSPFFSFMYTNHTAPLLFFSYLILPILCFHTCVIIIFHFPSLLLHTFFLPFYLYIPNYTVFLNFILQFFTSILSLYIAFSSATSVQNPWHVLTHSSDTTPRGNARKIKI